VALAVSPLHDTPLLFGETLTDEVFGGTTVGVGGCGGNVGLATESIPKITVGAADMLAKGVATFSFVSGQVMSARVLARLAGLCR
jgi:hypothetical protein